MKSTPFVAVPASRHHARKGTRELGLTVLVAVMCAGLGASMAAPIKVVVLAGQSNMEGHAHVRTIAPIALDPDAASLLQLMCNPDGTPRAAERVWISAVVTTGERAGKLTLGYGANTEKIGPEYTLGLRLERALEGPILLIKTAWGGKSLHTDFRPPSAGPFEFTEEQLAQLRRAGKDVDAIRAEKQKATGVYYRRMIEHVRKVLTNPGEICPEWSASSEFELAGFIWFQGWNDMVDSFVYPNRDKPGGYDLYSRLLAQLIRDVRRDLGAPQLPVVIGVMGVGGPIEPGSSNRYAAIHQEFRRAMAAPAQLPEFRDNVLAVFTEHCWDTRLAELRRRNEELEAKVRQLSKDATLTPDQRKAAIEQLKSQTFTPLELKLLDGASNAEFHYLGSAKILGRIGVAFAEALLKLMSNNPPTKV